MTFTESFLDELRGRVGLVQTIQRRVPLKKAGHEWKGCCPFHNEKTPSFYVNEEKQFYHCLAAETEVITAAGVRLIVELAGGSHRLLTTGGQWVDAPVRSFGVQRLWRVSLSRNGTEKVIHATDGHRWFVRGRKEALRTDALRAGHRLESVLPEATPDWTLDPAGIRHGIVYGKGTAGGGYHQMNLDDELYEAVVHLFPGSGHRRVDKAGRYRPIYIGKGYGDLKAPPRLDAPRAYLLGFLAGYIAADGHVSSDDGRVTLHSKARRHLEIARDIATVVGVGTFGIAERERSGFGSPPTVEHRVSFVASTLDPALFVLPRQREHFERRRVAYERLRWQVRSVERTDRVEEVFCAEVEGTHAFALEGNILTGNCFGCGAHGDVIRFVVEQDGLRFPEAVRQLAAECGLDIPDTTPEQRARDDRDASLHDIMDQAARFFAEQLQGLAGADARAYAASRGVTPEAIKRFGIGFAPAGNRLSAALKVEQARLVDCGLVGISEERREAFERFRNRLMFPIRDARGRVVGFGGRLLGATGPKYLNSPDTPLFDKGRLLYNLDQAGPLGRRSGRLIVVEGYMDVIALAQAGIAETVAPNGTALTEAQMRLLWRCVAEPLLCFDGDEAGNRAAERAAVNALPLLEPGVSLRFVTLPQGQDPDDIVCAGGAAAFEAILARAEPLIDRLWRSVMAGADMKTPERRAAARATLRGHVETIRHPDVRRLYASDFAARFDALFTQRRDPRAQARPAQLPRATGADAEACALILAALERPALMEAHVEKLAELATADRHAAAVLQAMCEAAGHGDTEHLAPRLRADGLAVAIDHVTAGAGRLSGIAARCFGDMLANVVERRRVDADLAAATARLAAGGGEDDFEAQRALAAERAALAARLREMVA